MLQTNSWWLHDAAADDGAGVGTDENGVDADGVHANAYEDGHRATLIADDGSAGWRAPLVRE